MATDVTICSNALMRLGAERFDAFTQGDENGENRKQVKLAAELWPTVRRQVLRANTWNCALKRTVLTPDVTAPAFGFANRFAKPADWLRTVFVGREPSDEYVYRTEGGFLLSDESELPIVYVYDNTDAGTYDSALVEAMEIGMAAAMANAVTGSTNTALQLADLLRNVLVQARGLDANDDPSETFGDFPLLSSRFSRGR